jgi:hypothetical protein
MDDVTAEFLDIDDSVAAPESLDGSSSDFEPLDIDLHFDDSIQAAPPSEKKKPASAPEPGFEAVTEFDDFLVDEGEKAPSAPNADFDDVSAVERELSAPPRGSSSPEPAKSDLSTEILLKIASELSSIRGELVSLKTRIGDVMVSVDSGPKKAAESDEEAPPESDVSGGFFDEEEDETIALTGDELDNILNTADFTTEEATGADHPSDIDNDSVNVEESFGDGELLSESLLPESGDYSVPESHPSAIEEVRFDDIGDEGLSLVAEEGVSVQTPAPDDTSYLESSEDLNIDAPLVEPDLSEFDLGPEEAEPRIEIDEELPLASTSAEDGASLNAEAFAEPELEELTLDIDAGPNYSMNAHEEGASEAEFIEPVPEIDEPNFAEINLHEENTGAEASELEDIDTLPEPDFLSPEPTPPLSAFEEEEEDLMLAAEEEVPATPTAAPAIKQPPAAEPKPRPAAKAQAPESDDGDRLKTEIKSVLSYLDKLLDSLPEEKIEEFARSKYFDTYKKLFEELGLV